MKRRAVSQVEAQGASGQQEAVPPRYKELYEKGKEIEDKLRRKREEK